VHEFNGIFDGEDVAREVGVDPVDHGRQGGALAGARGSGHQNQPFGPGGQLLEHLRKVEILKAGDLPALVMNSVSLAACRWQNSISGLSDAPVP